MSGLSLLCPKGHRREKKQKTIQKQMNSICLGMRYSKETALCLGVE